MTTVFEWEQPPVERRAAFQHNLLVFGEEFASASANEGPQGGLSAFAKGILLQTCPDGEVGNEVKLKDWKRDALGQQASMAGWGTSNNEPLPTLSMGSPGYVQAMTVREVSLLSIDEAEALLKDVPVCGSNNDPSRHHHQKTARAVIARFEDRDGEISLPSLSAGTYPQTAATVRSNVTYHSNTLFSIHPVNPSQPLSVPTKDICGFGVQVDET